MSNYDQQIQPSRCMEFNIHLNEFQSTNWIDWTTRSINFNTMVNEFSHLDARGNLYSKSFDIQFEVWSLWGTCTQRVSTYTLKCFVDRIGKSGYNSRWIHWSGCSMHISSVSIARSVNFGRWLINSLISVYGGPKEIQCLMTWSVNSTTMVKSFDVPTKVFGWLDR